MIWLWIGLGILAFTGMVFWIVRGLGQRERVVFASQCVICAMLGVGCFMAAEMYELKLWSLAVLFGAMAPPLMAPGFYMNMRYERPERGRKGRGE